MLPNKKLQLNFSLSAAEDNAGAGLVGLYLPSVCVEARSYASAVVECAAFCADIPCLHCA